MMHDEEKDIVIVSELTDEDDESWDLTPRQEKFVIFIISTVLFCILVFTVVSRDGDYGARVNAADTQQESSEQDYQAELKVRTDELCLERVKSCTKDEILSLDDFLARYKCKYSNDEWANENGTLSFDLGSNESPALRYVDKNGNSYTRALTRELNDDCNYAKIGNNMLPLSKDDITALGRVLVGDTSGFVEN
jgi:hypothetical protein